MDWVLLLILIFIVIYMYRGGEETCEESELLL